MSCEQHVTIYKVTNLVNGKAYIGQTIGTPKRRFYEHTYEARNPRGRNVFHAAIRKHGERNFYPQALLVCSAEMANYYEAEMVKLHGTHAGNGGGYNCANPLNHHRSISSAKGEKHGSAKLTDAQALEIRTRTDLNSREVCALYGVGRHTVNGIRNGTRWKHLPFDPSVVYPVTPTDARPLCTINPWKKEK